MNKEKEDICYGGLKGYGKTYCEMIRLQQENNQLKEQLKGVREEREYLFNKLSIENKYLQQENQQLHNKIEKLEDELFLYKQLR